MPESLELQLPSLSLHWKVDLHAWKMKGLGELGGILGQGPEA